jgi:hydrogenase maturation protease
MDDWRRKLGREIRKSRRVAVLGIGNPARADDAAGVLAARRLLSRAAGSGVRTLVLVTEETPESFTGVVRSFAPDLAVLLDAVSGSGPPGTISLVDPRRMAEEDVTTHRIPLGKLVLYMERTIGCRVRVLGIEPASLEPGRAVSPEVAAAVAEVVDLLASVLA